MVELEQTLIVATRPEMALAYAADIENLTRWDPSISSVRRLRGFPLQTGSRYLVMAHFLSAPTPLLYTLDSYEPGSRAILTGSGLAAAVRDIIEVREHDRGCALTWRAEIALRGPLSRTGGVMQPAFDRMADKAMVGLAKALGGRAAR